MERAVAKKSGQRARLHGCRLGQQAEGEERERENVKKKTTISCWGLKEKMREQMMMRVKRERECEEEDNNQLLGMKQKMGEQMMMRVKRERDGDEEENNQLLGVKENMRGERAEEVENNGNGHQEVCEFCTWVCGNSTHLITNAMTTTTAAAARILKQPPSPFFTKTLTIVNLSSHVTPSLVRAPPAMEPVVLLL